ncbi:MAG: ParB/RepB/Spo0J family partition protein, partial [Bowdeniella nasicola]|nr:ParB/RepB/Spo0J family partition protein [Bowdeniella nasicola]
RTPAVRGSVRNAASNKNVEQEKAEEPAPTTAPEKKASSAKTNGTTPGKKPEANRHADRQKEAKTATKQKPRAATTGSAGSDNREQPAREDSQLKPIEGLAAGEINIADIAPNPQQPRTIFDEEELEELAASIREVGLLQPIVVRPAPAGSEKPFELIMGERRWRASQLADLEAIPAIIRSTDDEDLLRDALLENLHRANLNPLEEASAYQQLLEDFNCTHDELARRIARSRPQISNTLRLLKLPPLVQRRVAAGVLSAGHARALLGLTDPGAMERLAQRIVAEGLSVRAVEEIIALGDEPVAPEQRRRRIANPVAPALDELATRLADRFDTRVKVAMGARKGRITVEFAGLEDLDRILAVLAPGEQAPGDDTSPR